MFTQLRNLADIASILNTSSTMGMPNTFGECTPLSTIAEPGTPSDMDISSSAEHSPSPLLFHIDLQDEDKKSSPIAIPLLPPIDDLFEQNDRQVAKKTIPFTKPPHPMEEIWAERAAQEAEEAEADGMKPSTIISNGIQIQPYTIDDWSLSPHSAKWDSPSTTKYMPADITRMALTMVHDQSEEEVSSILDQWPSPPSMPPAGDDMHPPAETFSGAHPGEEWEYNAISKPKYFRFLISDPSIPCCQIIAPWIKYDLNPIRPSISGTFGKYHPVVTRPLRPSPMDYTCPPLTPDQTAVLRQDESFLDVVDYIIQEHLSFDVQAGVQQFCHYDNARQAIQTTITQLQDKYMHYLKRSMEVLSDLENANVLGCILAHHEDFDNNPKAYATFFTKVAPFKGHVTNSGRDTTVDPYAAGLISFGPPASACTVSDMYYTPLLTYAEAVKKSRAPPTMPRAMHNAPRRDMPRPVLSTLSITSSDCSTISGRHRSKRCHKCHTLGHIRQECPNWHKSCHY
jgi:hypothetical protein